jgi:hypothetical protein
VCQGGADILQTVFYVTVTVIYSLNKVCTIYELVHVVFNSDMLALLCVTLELVTTLTCHLIIPNKQKHLVFNMYEYSKAYLSLFRLYLMLYLLNVK